jgi:hypothetical protein
MTLASSSAVLVVAGLTSLYGLLLLVSFLGLYMMARSSIGWKKSDNAPHSATVEDCVAVSEQMLLLHWAAEYALGTIYLEQH